METKWIKQVPKKISAFVWRASLGRLPCREVLDQMYLDLHTKLCTQCESTVDSVDHALVSCHEVNILWKDLHKWWGIRGDGITTLHEILNTKARTKGDATRSGKSAAVVWSFLYLIWTHRNHIVFKGDNRKLSYRFFDSNFIALNGLCEERWNRR